MYVSLWNKSYKNVHAFHLIPQNPAAPLYKLHIQFTTNCWLVSFATQNLIWLFRRVLVSPTLLWLPHRRYFFFSDTFNQTRFHTLCRTVEGLKSLCFHFEKKNSARKVAKGLFSIVHFVFIVLFCCGFSFKTQPLSLLSTLFSANHFCEI